MHPLRGEEGHLRVVGDRPAVAAVGRQVPGHAVCAEPRVDLLERPDSTAAPSASPAAPASRQPRMRERASTRAAYCVPSGAWPSSTTCACRCATSPPRGRSTTRGCACSASSPSRATTTARPGAGRARRPRAGGAPRGDPAGPAGVRPRARSLCRLLPRPRRDQARGHPRALTRCCASASHMAMHGATVAREAMMRMLMFMHPRTPFRRAYSASGRCVRSACSPWCCRTTSRPTPSRRREARIVLRPTIPRRLRLRLR